MKPRLLQILVVVLAAVALFLWHPWREDTHHPVDQELIAKLQAENRDLQAQIDRLRAHGDHPQSPVLPESGGAGSTGRRTTARGGLNGLPGAADQSQTVETLQQQLASAQQNATDLNAKVADLQAQLEKARQEQSRVTASEASLKDQVAAAMQQAEAATAELARRNEQLVRSEAANKKLRDETTGGSMKAAQVLKLTKELQDLSHRREGIMTTILGRYRDITEQYRALARFVDSRRGPEGTPGTGLAFPSPEMTRIQNTVGMVEEDVRQLNAVNAQLLQVQKKLQTL
jgi:DNA repair exonuclease SbcCD ATPase subunit